MLGIREQRFGARVLHQHAHVHDCDAIADVLHHAQVVGDEQVGQAVLFLQVLQEVQNLGLHGHVEGGDRLVEDDQLRVQGQGPCDADALPLAAAEGVGIAVQVLRPQSHHAQQIGYPFLQFVAGGHAVDQQRLAHVLQEVHAGVERGIGILEDHLHVLAQVLHLRRGQFGDVEVVLLAAPEPDFTVRHVVGAHDDAARRGLATAAFADQAQGLAGPDVEADPVNGLDVADRLGQEAALDGKVFPEVLDVQQHLLGTSGRGVWTAAHARISVDYRSRKTD